MNQEVLYSIVGDNKQPKVSGSGGFVYFKEDNKQSQVRKSGGFV